MKLKLTRRQERYIWFALNNYRQGCIETSCREDYPPDLRKFWREKADNIEDLLDFIRECKSITLNCTPLSYLKLNKYLNKHNP